MKKIPDNIKKCFLMREKRKKEYDENIGKAISLMQSQVFYLGMNKIDDEILNTIFEKIIYYSNEFVYLLKGDYLNGAMSSYRSFYENIIIFTILANHKEGEKLKERYALNTLAMLDKKLDESKDKEIRDLFLDKKSTLNKEIEEIKKNKYVDNYWWIKILLNKNNLDENKKIGFSKLEGEYLKLIGKNRNKENDYQLASKFIHGEYFKSIMNSCNIATPFYEEYGDNEYDDNKNVLGLFNSQLIDFVYCNFYGILENDKLDKFENIYKKINKELHLK